MDMQITQQPKRDEWVETAPGVMQAVRFETACGMMLYEAPPGNETVQPIPLRSGLPCTVRSR